MKFKIIMAFCTLIAISSVTTFIFYSYGNPQWSKHVYLWQANVFPKHEDGIIKPPKDYVGIWKDWINKSTLAEHACANGKMHPSGYRYLYDDVIGLVYITYPEY